MRTSTDTGKLARSLAERLPKAQVSNAAEAQAVARQLSFELTKAFAEKPASELARERFGRWETDVQYAKDGLLTHNAHTPDQTAVSTSDGDHDSEHLPAKCGTPEETRFTLAQLNVIAEKRQRYELLLLVYRYAASGCPIARGELLRHVARHYSEYVDAWGQIRGEYQVASQPGLSKHDADEPACRDQDACTGALGTLDAGKTCMDGRKGPAAALQGNAGEQGQPGDVQGQVNVLNGVLVHLLRENVERRRENVEIRRENVERRRENVEIRRENVAMRGQIGKLETLMTDIAAQRKEKTDGLKSQMTALLSVQQHMHEQTLFVFQQYLRRKGEKWPANLPPMPK